MPKEPSPYPNFARNRHPLGPDLEVERKYALSYDWGILHVSKEADAAYGLVPLSANSMSDHELEAELAIKEFRANIYLFAPHEFNRGNMSQNALEDESANGVARVYRRGIELFLELDSSKADVEAGATEQVRTITEQEGMSIEDVTNSYGIPITDAIMQESGQILAHQLDSSINTMLEYAISEAQRGHADREALLRQAYLGGVGVVGATGLLANSFFAPGEISAFDAGIAVAYGGTLSTMAWNAMRRHMSTRQRREQHIDEQASVFSQYVADAIHSTYCTANFDHKLRNMFGES